eukprot:PhF_6_TR10919/c0_g1_i2/m.17652
MEDLAKTTLNALGIEVNKATMDIALSILNETPRARQIRALQPQLQTVSATNTQSNIATNQQAHNNSSSSSQYPPHDATPGFKLFYNLKAPKVIAGDPRLTAEEVFSRVVERWMGQDCDRARYESKALKQSVL